jgi:hypothetical protein
MPANIVFIEFLDGVPRAAIDADGEEYDLHYSTYYKCLLYTPVGNGDLAQPLSVYGALNGKTTYWHSKRVAVCVKSGEAVRRTQLPSKYSLARFFSDAICVEDTGGCVWCSECEDWVLGNDECQHVDWCESCGLYSSPDEPCEHFYHVYQDSSEDTP